uniref:Transmembrane protein n=1 Tax=Chromera velia CCMP2878 TaxID=1169474 RepID=A0A0G4H9N5_9ALVE|eukprot:Cvel_6004.t1-p1 / transcript=Cvel_6004.t1 / gene=Cvel_6004 / organism=Chromera_velia_CCMP2878 / gene_product=hypothetical protein / transcript_product=hypothetical protein / location=Cvel_scaffold287:79547-80255(+) / protein_length=162 / sequence_SO=supercontig / SO=protein_coding / is_pseudo=false
MSEVPRRSQKRSSRTRERERERALGGAASGSFSPGGFSEAAQPGSSSSIPVLDLNNFFLGPAFWRARQTFLLAACVFFAFFSVLHFERPPLQMTVGADARMLEKPSTTMMTETFPSLVSTQGQGEGGQGWGESSHFLSSTAGASVEMEGGFSQFPPSLGGRP